MEKPGRSHFDQSDNEEQQPMNPSHTELVTETDENTPTEAPTKGRGESMDDFLLRMAAEHQQQLEANRKRKEGGAGGGPGKNNGYSQTLPTPKRDTSQSSKTSQKGGKNSTSPTPITTSSTPNKPTPSASDDDSDDDAVSSDSADSNDESVEARRRGLGAGSGDDDDDEDHDEHHDEKQQNQSSGGIKGKAAMFENVLNKSTPKTPEKTSPNKTPPPLSPPSQPQSIIKPVVPGSLPILTKRMPGISTSPSSTSTPSTQPHIISPNTQLAKAHEKVDPNKKKITASPPLSPSQPPILTVPTHSLLITNVNTQRMLKGHNMTRYIHSSASSRARQKSVMQKHVTVYFSLGDEETKKNAPNAAAALGCIWWCDEGTRQRNDKNMLYLTDILHVYLGKQMDIWDTDVGRSAKDACVWTVISDHEAIHFETQTPQDRHTWIDGLSFIMKSCGRSMSVQQQDAEEEHGHGTPAPGSKIQISYSSVGGSGRHKKGAPSRSHNSRNSKNSSRNHPSAMISLSAISTMSSTHHDSHEHSERYDDDDSETLSLSSEDDGETQDAEFLEEEKATSPEMAPKTPPANEKSEEIYQEVWRSPSPSVLADVNVQTMLRGSLFTLYSYTYSSPSIANLDPMSAEAQSSIVAIQSNIFLFYVPTFGGSRGSICWSEPPTTRPITHATPRTVNASNCVDFDELMDIYVGKHTEIFTSPVAVHASEDRCMTLVGGEDSEPVFDEPEPDYTGLSAFEVEKRKRARSEERRRIKESLKRIELNLEAENAQELNAWVDGLTHILVNCGKDVVLVKEETPAAASSPSSGDEHKSKTLKNKNHSYINTDTSHSISMSSMSSVPSGVSISTSTSKFSTKSSNSGWATTSLGSGGVASQGAAAVASGADQVNPLTGSIRRKISVSRNRLSRAIDVSQLHEKTGSGSAKYIKFQQMLRDGGVFKKWKHKRPVKRRIWCSPNMDHLIWGDLSKKVIKGFLLSKEITAVKQVYEGNSNRIFLHSAHRLLELEAPSLELAKEWMQAFDFLINVHNREMARIFQEKSSGPKKAEFEAMQTTMAKRLQDGDVFRYRSPQKPFKKEAYKLRFLYCDHMLTNLIVRKETKAGKLKSQIAIADIAQVNDMKGSDTKLAIWAKGLCLELEAQTRVRRDQFIESLSFFLAIKRR